jgi:hypothetical protein
MPWNSAAQKQAKSNGLLEVRPDVHIAWRGYTLLPDLAILALIATGGILGEI